VAARGSVAASREGYRPAAGSTPGARPVAYTPRFVRFAGGSRARVNPSSSPRKLLIEARRRGWLVLLCAVLVAAVAYGAARALSRSWSAEAVFVVRVGGPLSAQPDASTKLATTYATLIPLDSAVQSAVAAAGAHGSFTASSDANTAVLRVTYKGGSEGSATRGAAAVARAISGPTPASASIAPRTIAIVRLPASATRSGGTPAQAALVGAVLGLLLGLVLVAFWRARDARVDDLRELRRELSCPCFEVDRRSAAGSQALIEALASSPHRTAAVLPCRARDERAAAALRGAIAQALGDERAIGAAPPGSDAAGELVAAGADATILVVATGARLAELGEAVDVLSRYDAAPAFAVLARRGGPPATPGLPLPDEAGAPARSAS